MSYTE